MTCVGYTRSCGRRSNLRKTAPQRMFIQSHDMLWLALPELGTKAQSSVGYPTRPMQNLGYGFSRIKLLDSTVNKDVKGAGVVPYRQPEACKREANSSRR